MRKNVLIAAAAAAAALTGTIAFAADPITEFLLHSDRATVRVPPVPAAAQKSPAATSISEPQVNPGDNSLRLEEPFRGGNVTAEGVAARFREVKGLMLRVCGQPDNQPYFRKTPCIASSLTDEQAADESTVTPDEAKAAKRVFSQIDAINEKTRKIMVASGQDAHEDAVRLSEAKIDPKVKENQEALVSGRISWGKYNRQRMALTRRAR